MKQVKIYSAIFRSEEQDGSNPQERVEFFCDKDLVAGDVKFEPENYATDFLRAQGEWLDELLEEDPITDNEEIQRILGEALNYIRDVCENNGFDCGDVAQDLEKLLVSHIATT